MNGEKLDYLVVGGGPAGAWFARLAADRGYRVAVVDAYEPGGKVCGGAIPRLYEEQVSRVPSDAVVTEVRGFRVYLDGELLWEETGSLWGYLLDKKRFIHSILEGIPVYKHRVYDFREGRVRGLDLRWERLVIAAGPLAPGYKGDRIYAVQAVYRGEFEEGVIEIHFDSRLVGYYWVFPVSGREARVGVGGYGDPKSFLGMLEAFAKRLGAERVEEPRGSWLNIGGAEPSLAVRSDAPVVGEAAGFVYPVTGEGIRPAALSAIHAFRLLEGDESARARLEALARSINAQRKLLDFVKSASPEGRARFMRRMGGELAMRVALGDLGAMEKLLTLIPSRFARLLAKLLG